jgi:DNA-binding PadR family transcriptional regulator
MLELAILGLLEDREMHGYEIRKRLRDDLGLFSNVSFGSLYPALSRLERQGAVETTDDPAGTARPSVPMTGSLSGERAALRSLRSGASRSRRSRRVFRITDAGRRQFSDLLSAETPAADEARSFSLRLAFARYLPPHARLRLLERRRAQLADRLSTSRAATAGGGSRLDRYARSLMEHTTEATEREISWLERLIDAERSSGTQPAEDPSGGVPQPPTTERAGT